MDPKALSALDPKMKETYDRVMGTTATPRPAPPAGVPTLPTQPAPVIPASPPIASPNPVDAHSPLPVIHPATPLTPASTSPVSSSPIPPVGQTPIAHTLPVTAPLASEVPPLSPSPLSAASQGAPKAPITSPLPPLTPPQPASTTPHTLTMPNPAVPLRTPMTSYQASPNVQTPIHPIMEEKKGSAGKVILFTILGLIFFAVYGVFWLKFLNFPLPF